MCPKKLESPGKVGLKGLEHTRLLYFVFLWGPHLAMLSAYSCIYLHSGITVTVLGGPYGMLEIEPRWVAQKASTYCTVSLAPEHMYCMQEAQKFDPRNYRVL